MRDLLEEIWATVRRNKLRTTLTGFAVSWGIFMLIVLLGAGNGVIHGLEQNSGDYLDRSMTVSASSTGKPYGGFQEGRVVSLRDHDIQATKDHFSNHVDEVSSELMRGPVNIAYGGNTTTSYLNGVYSIEQSISNVKVLYGRFINDLDNQQRRRVTVIIEDRLKDLDAQPEHMVGQTIKVDGLAYKVVGVMKSNQTGFQSDVYVPYRTLQSVYNTGDKTDNIVFTFHGLETEADNEAFEKQYKTMLNRNHYAAPDDDKAFWIWNRFIDAMNVDQGMGLLRKSLWIVGLLTLLSGVVGISNIMLISVKERTREFGIRKAIGAKPWSLLKLIITESVIITTFFGYIGMVLGIIANNYMDATLGHNQVDMGVAKFSVFVNPTVDFSICVQATLVMVLAGTLAGFIPARKAARIRPIEALRAE